MAFSVLYVCTGNVCRSPMAELIFRSRLSLTPSDVLVASAGMRALTNQRIDDASAAALVQIGLDPSKHRARQFEPWMARDADLVLTAEREHRDAIMTAFPPAFRRTFTMREFARSVAHADAADPREVVAQVAGARHLAGEVPLELDDVTDPFGGSIEDATAVLRQVEDTVTAAVTALGFAAPAAPRPRPHRPLDPSRRPMPYKR